MGTLPDAPLLAELTTHADAAVRERAVGDLRSLGRVDVEYLSRIQGQSPELDRHIATSLDRLRADQKFRSSRWIVKLASGISTVPLLIRQIRAFQQSRKWDDQDAIRTAVQELGRRGNKAAEAVPLLTELLGHESQWVRIESIQALWGITRDASLVVPRLVEHLLPEPVGRRAVEMLQEVGPEAREALPALRRIAESDERFITSDMNVCASDEEFQSAAIAAIEAIEKR